MAFSIFNIASKIILIDYIFLLFSVPVKVYYFADWLLFLLFLLVLISNFTSKNCCYGYLFRSGLRLDLEKLKVATDFSDQVRLEEGKVFTNGMMWELLKVLGDFLINDMFFLLLKSTVPVSILSNKKDRQQFVDTKLKVFITKAKSVQKTKSKIITFQDEEFNFLIRPVIESTKKSAKEENRDT